MTFQRTGLDHDFALITMHNLPLIKNCYIFHHQEHLASEVVPLHDDFIIYFADSFQWLDSFNPSTNTPQKSLCYHGYTLFDQKTVKKFKKILTAWHSLFKNAPPNFSLTGSWTEIIGEENSGKYEEINVNRNDLLNRLSRLIQLCEMVEQNDKLVLLHGGI